MKEHLSGQQKADQNLSTFLSWVASKTDADYREMVLRGKLNRKEIARECGFAKSVLLQPPRVRDSLKTLEADLRERYSRLLDRTLLYTAITRPQKQVILVGDVAAAKAAVEAPPHASLRQVALGSMLTEILKGMA